MPGRKPPRRGETGNGFMAPPRRGVERRRRTSPSSTTAASVVHSLAACARAWASNSSRMSTVAFTIIIVPRISPRPTTWRRAFLSTAGTAARRYHRTAFAAPCASPRPGQWARAASSSTMSPRAPDRRPTAGSPRPPSAPSTPPPDTPQRLDALTRRPAARGCGSLPRRAHDHGRATPSASRGGGLTGCPQSAGLQARRRPGTRRRRRPRQLVSSSPALQVDAVPASGAGGTRSRGTRRPRALAGGAHRRAPGSTLVAIGVPTRRELTAPGCQTSGFAPTRWVDAARAGSKPASSSGFRPGLRRDICSTKRSTPAARAVRLVQASSSPAARGPAGVREQRGHRVRVTVVPWLRRPGQGRWSRA